MAIVDPFNRAFAKKLTALMHAKGWNQAELVRRASVHNPMSRANVSSYCSGRQIPGPPRLSALARALGVKVDELLPVQKTRATASPVSVKDLGNGRAHLSIDQEVSWDVALEVMRLLNVTKSPA